MSLPIATWFVEREARSRAATIGAQLGLTIEWTEISLSLAGLTAIDASLRDLRVDVGDDRLVDVSNATASVAWRDGALVVDSAVLTGAKLQVRLVHDQPEQLVAVRDAWRARGGGTQTAGDADAEGPATSVPASRRPWPPLRLQDCHVVIAAVGGRSAVLDGLDVGVEAADLAMARPQAPLLRPTGTLQANVALEGPATGKGAVTLRSDGQGVAFEATATSLPWRWQRAIGAMRSASAQTVSLQVDLDTALALRAASPDASLATLRDAVRGSLRLGGIATVLAGADAAAPGAAAPGAAASDAAAPDAAAPDAGGTDGLAVRVGDLRARWPESAVQLDSIAMRSPTWRNLRAVLPSKLGGVLQELAIVLALPDEASVSLDIDALDAGKVAVLLAGGGEPSLRGLRLRLGERRIALGRFDVRRPGATLIGQRKPAELHVVGLRIDAGDLTPTTGSTTRTLVPQPLLALVARLQQATQQHGDDQEPAVGSAEAGPPPEAQRPLWTSTPAKTEPSTRKYAAPLAALPAKLDAAVASIAALRERLAKQKMLLDVRDAAFSAQISGLAIGLLDVDFALQPRVGAVAGRAALSLSLMLRGRSAGSLSLSMALPSSSLPIELAVSAKGDDLARVVASLDRRLGLGARPSLQLDGLLVAGAGIGGELSATVAVQQIGLDWWRFAERKVDDVALDADLRLHWPADLGWMRLDVGEVAFGAAGAAPRMRASGWVQLHRLKPSPRVDLSLLLPSQDCGTALDAIPDALLPTVGRIRAHGPVSGWVDLRLDIAHPWYSEIDFALDDSRCVIETTGKLDVDGLKGDFERPVNEDGTLLQDQTFGPLSPAWIAIGRMPRWLPYAMTTTEDGGFFQHHGLNAFLLNRAIRLDLHVGRFVYGGSTITQQLAKNLFFRRTKVLSRKLEEALATWLLERRLGKARILEIYANAVEMAPHLYGVARGAQYYFGKDADQLGPAEAAWLGILKPCPRCAGAHFRAKSMPGWYQQRLLEILTRMWRNHIIDDATFEFWQNRVPPFVDWPAEKLAQRSAWPIPEKKEPEPRRLDRGRSGDGARTDKARADKARTRAPGAPSRP